MTRPFVIDTNLLVLLIVGKAGRQLIARHKRLAAFNEQDYDELCDLIAQAPSVWVTPNTLTETSNLAAQIAEPARRQILTVLGQLLSQVDECYVSSETAASRPEFLRLGLTDSALLEVAANDAVLLTADLPLYQAALSAERSAINFNHLREAWL